MGKPLSQTLREKIVFKGFKTSLSQTIFSTGIQICQFFFTYLLIHFLTTRLLPGDFGLYSVARAFSDIILLLANFGLSRYLGREIPASEERRQNNLFISCLRVEGLVFVAMVGAVFLFLGPLTTWLKIGEHRLLFFAFTAISIFPLFHSELIALLNFKKNIKTSVFLGALEQFLIVASLFVLMHLHQSTFTIHSVLGAFCLAYVMTFVIDNFFLPRKFWSDVVVEPRAPMVSLRNPQLFLLLMIEIIFLLFFQTEKFFLSSYTTLEAAGIFSYGLTWNLLIWRLSRMPFIFTYPHFAEFFKQGDMANARKSLFFSVSFSLSLALLGAVIVSQLGPMVFPYVSSQDYTPGLEVIRKLFFVPLLLNLALMGQYLLVLTHNEKRACTVFACCFLFKVALCRWAIPTQGIHGSILALNASYALLGGLLIAMIISDKKLNALFLPSGAVAGR